MSPLQHLKNKFRGKYLFELLYLVLTWSKCTAHADKHIHEISGQI
uniref:Uncharacterized protein n=1 Tax=Rhizophora mucronata TaxID=61149 RepID=A0A2P2PYB4_RHIMU